MLNFVEEGDKMFIEVNLSMSNSNSIISAALLDAIWEEQKKGVLDLLLPFAIYILSDNYSENDTISLETVGLEMTRKFGFSHVPNSVIFQVLNMLTKKDNNCLLKKEGSEFILVKYLSAEHEKFDEKYSIVKGSTENFLNSFIEEYNTVNRKKITLEEAKDILLEILNDKGYDVFFEPLELNRITMDSSNKKTFCLAQYIIKVLNDENHKHYKALTGIASGALMSNIVYINTDVNEYKEKPLKDLKIYFDTSLLLFALGFKTAYQKDNMDCILNMLKTNGAELFYFDNNLSELNSILTAYKHRTINSTGQRLEYFDENNIHSNMLDFFIHGLEERLAKNGFKKSSLFEYPRKASEYKYSKYEIIDEAGLKKHLQERIEKYKDEQVSNDVACIASICRERRGRISKTLEKSEAIWVTSNINLLKNTKEFLKFPNDAILPIISVYSLSTEIWLKYGVVVMFENLKMATNDSFTKRKVIEFIEKDSETNKEIQMTVNAIKDGEKKDIVFAKLTKEIDNDNIVSILKSILSSKILPFEETSFLRNMSLEDYTNIIITVFNDSIIKCDELENVMQIAKINEQQLKCTIKLLKTVMEFIISQRYTSNRFQNEMFEHFRFDKEKTELLWNICNENSKQLLEIILLENYQLCKIVYRQTAQLCSFFENIVFEKSDPEDAVIEDD